MIINLHDEFWPELLSCVTYCSARCQWPF